DKKVDESSPPTRPVKPVKTAIDVLGERLEPFQKVSFLRRVSVTLVKSGCDRIAAQPNHIDRLAALGPCPRLIFGKHLHSATTPVGRINPPDEFLRAKLQTEEMRLNGRRKDASQTAIQFKDEG